MTATVYLLIRIAAAVGGALIGYFVMGPALRLLYRLAFQRPVPGWLLPLGRLGGAALIGALIFFFLPLGGGPGWGWGPGWGAGPGEGTGKAESGDKVKVVNGTKKGAVRDKLVIELLGGSRYMGEGRYYLIRGEASGQTLGEVEEYIMAKADKLLVQIKVTDESVAPGHVAVGRLHELLQRYQIPTVTSSD